ncbi:COP9 signalosome complex subunit 7 [Sporothrix brasiliensis 5110]|uniref:COP9 signalosome complex subunit 7 n=1 Tax=Sporothrix brasiliensis 5110 TaxID=1398154 RepID=A0A0C2J5M9_9PEZI|nr:COP9 signalosome complex subunit 7 [Sporothrix brasiliensis 5110]KIH94295.1 COP9 signalosome complex subunit 7 [Sporothrix brasiliensis 5110]
MAQLKAMDALEPFVALSKSASSPRQAADLVVRATSHPSTYFFAELLQTPQIQALATADPEYAAYLAVLQIFSYGTYADYERGTAPSASSSQPSHPQSISQSQAASAAVAPPLPPLTDAQATKLRELSLISLATDRSSLGYDHLVRELRLDDARQLETLVMAAVYAGLVTGTLDPAHQVVRISAVAPMRDPAPDAIPRLHAALSSWSQRCESTLAALDEQIAGIRRTAAARAEEGQKSDSQFKRAVETEKRAMLNKDGGSGDADDGGGNGGGHGKRPMTLNVSSGGKGIGNPRFNKRGSNLMATSIVPPSSHAVPGPGSALVAEDNDGAMDLDDDEGDGNKRNRNA